MALTFLVAGFLGFLAPAPSTSSTCQLTPPDALGPFYVANAPRRAKVGTGHVLTGIVRTTKICTPIAGARVELWLAAPNGRYHSADRATVLSRKDGTYRFESNFPPPYDDRQPHIHIRVTARGFQTLVTQFYPCRGQARGKLDLVLALAR